MKKEKKPKKATRKKAKDPIAVEMGRRGGKKGGKSRMALLSPEERSELGRRGAEAKRAVVAGLPSEIPKAIAEGVIPNSGIQCAVLDDANNTRVLSQRGVGRVLGAPRGGRHFVEGGGDLPFFLSQKNLKPYISDELRVAASKPIVYMGEGGINYGVPAQLLPQILKVWVDAQVDGALKMTAQNVVADKAKAMLVALAGVAMVALVDEATGFQYVRARDALAQILERFIAKELQGWERTFEPDFYRYLLKLQGWAYDPTSVKRPRRAAALTTDIVYQRLAPGVLDELTKLREKYKLERGLKTNPHLHRGLTREYGWIKLREHIASVTTLMDIAPDWQWFTERLDRRHPRYGKTLLLPFSSDLKNGNGDGDGSDGDGD